MTPAAHIYDLLTRMDRAEANIEATMKAVERIARAVDAMINARDAERVWPEDGGKDVEYAFPVTTANFTQSHGITLRDWFAGQALAGIASISGGGFSLQESAAASWAYQYADAMLAARKDTPNG